MKLEINNLYGIRNELSFNLGKKNIIFAPNGSGKTSITKGMKGLSENTFVKSMEGEIEDNAIRLKEVSNDQIYVVDKKLLDSIINDSDGIIRNIMKSREQKLDFAPSNLYADYLSLFNNTISDLKEYEIEFDKTEYFTKYTEENIVENTKKLLLNKTTYEHFHNNDIEEISILVKQVNKSLQAIIKVEKDIRTNYIELDKKIKRIKKFNKVVDVDYPLTNRIIESQSNNFLYKYKDKIITIKEAEKQLKELFKNNGISEVNIEAFRGYKEINEIRRKIQNKPISITKRSNAQKKDALLFLNEIKKDALIIILQTKKHNFEIIEEKIKKNEIKFIKNYNKTVRDLNKEMLSIDFLKWQIQIKEIKRYYEKTTALFIDGKSEKTSEDLQEYASSGQRRILALILVFIEAKNYTFTLMDDPVTSLDSDNINIFKWKLEEFEKHILVLTHNYKLLCDLAWVENIKTFVMDSYSEKEVIKKEIDPESIISIPKWLSEKNYFSKKRKVLMFSTIIRELIDNYIIEGYSKNTNTKTIKQLVKLKILMDKNYRHWKSTETTFTKAKNKILSLLKISPEILELFTAKNNPLKLLFEFESNEVITNFVLNYKKRKKIDNFFDYVSNKYLMTLQVRFRIEEELIDKCDVKDWNNSKYYGIEKLPNYQDMNKDKKKLYEQLNFMNHINNLRWTPIVEMPLYKIEKYSSMLK